ncbi:MAG: bacteriocin [Ruminococcus sp.]|jgi:bacteriocin-like protein|nr:bacteriocin [Ruminococcus sp.]
MKENKVLTDDELDNIVGGYDLTPIRFRYTCGGCGFTAVAEALEFNVELLKYMVGGCCPVCQSANLNFEKLKY